ncbi:MULTISPECIES: SDR family NAD(P)-dependent oxidoreductase [unclassified Microbulbifer]|uniref:SDR family NAD(P)-dependent oxidoreductase n=1 Tax=Microbulbifer spongiae TaxID=2944933 RepID=A0ABY9EA61_9GAMM|nr:MULTISPECIES: SDR family NAD(P)-dependent oxidoreductase [unclassified Microbulbifer]MDP5209285.1 SDR family NAD(P)-dependent oxidoreductase [Microbulbifer sp. 2205BS26-8]WKD49042.1 SDR family NAD(P)-dependent oxidoreductase [Microbulbifer sp. MI-G]
MSKTKNRIVLVTGATRGIGKGTALALSGDDTIVYITGRSESENQTSSLPGTLSTTVAEIKERGGQVIPVKCDHNDDKQIAQLLERVMDEQGQLDILVNCVYQVPDDLSVWKPFWQRPVEQHWNAMINVGLRAHYLACYHAAPHMVKAQSGLMVTVSSPAARAYIHSVIYGLGKAAKDKMMYDIAKELREYNVAAFALWPGIVRTERLQPAIENNQLPAEYEVFKSGMESSEFTGRIIDAVDRSNTAMTYTGASWWNTTLAKKMGIVDIDGQQPESYAKLLGNPINAPEIMIK